MTQNYYYSLSSSSSSLSSIIITGLRKFKNDAQAKDYDRLLVQEYFSYLYSFSVRNSVRFSECNSFILLFFSLPLIIITTTLITTIDHQNESKFTNRKLLNPLSERCTRMAAKSATAFWVLVRVIECTLKNGGTAIPLTLITWLIIMVIFFW